MASFFYEHCVIDVDYVVGHHSIKIILINKYVFQYI